MKDEKAPKTLTTIELEKFILYVRDNHNSALERLRAERNYLMILLMADAGLRVGELIQLKKTDFHVMGNLVDSLILGSDITKTHCDRIVPLTQRTRYAMSCMHESIWQYNIIPQNVWAFFDRNLEGHITARQVQRICETAGLRSIGRKVNPHALRHTFASRAMRVTNIRVVQQLLGHKSLSSTQIYTHPNGDDLQKAVDNLES